MPDAVSALVEYCAGLPLALSIAAARAVTHPDLPLAALADELRDTSTRLDALETADITASLSWSYDALPLPWPAPSVCSPQPLAPTSTCLPPRACWPSQSPPPER